MVVKDLKYCDAHVHLSLIDGFSILDNSIVINCVTNSPAEYAEMHRFFGKHKSITISMGYHPLYISESKRDLNEFLKQMSYVKYIGEIGLDVKSKISIDFQEYVLKQIVKITGDSGNYVLNVHNRGALNRLLHIFSNYHGIVVFHRFSGNKEQRDFILSHRNWYISINPQLVLLSDWNIIRDIPITRLLIETDAPFTLPSKSSYDAKHLGSLYEFLSIKIEMPFSKVVKSIEHNFADIYLGD